MTNKYDEALDWFKRSIGPTKMLNKTVQPTPEAQEKLDVIEEALTIVSSMQWQPMETAPKDGTQFLVTDGECVIIAEWGNEIIDVWDSTCHMVFDTPPHANITHWMSLPEPPTGE